MQLYYANPALQVAILLAEPLHFAVAYFGDTNQVLKIKNYYDELKNFYRKYPEESKIREQLSMALHHLLTSRYFNARENVDDILLLYKLRFDLCNAAKDQTIMGAIIKFVTKEISEIIAEKHREGGNQLKEFVNKVKLLLNNTSDFIILCYG